MTPADEMMAAVELLRTTTYGFGADYFFRRDVAEASKKKIFSGGAEEWLKIMIPSNGKLMADWLERVSHNVRFEVDVNSGRACLSGDQEAALAFARGILTANEEGASRNTLVGEQ